MTLADVLSARRRLSGLVLRTPLVESPWLSDISGRAIHLKLESLQPTGSFKVRGALNATLALVAKSPDSPVLVTASAGNHGRALAYAARRVGLRAIVYTPRNAPKMKLEGIAQLGAELRAVADDYDAAERLAKEAARRGDGVFLSPYSHPDLIAATGTIGLEIVEDLPEIDAVVVPLGGGGLISGVALAIKSVSPRTEVIGVETEASHAFHASLAAGRIVEVDVKATIADGLAGNIDPDTITFDFVRRYVDRMVIVDEQDLEKGIRELAARQHLIAEGAGIAGVAAVLSGKLEAKGRTIAAIVSGSNIDLERLTDVMQRDR